jgi:hypothetical protein
VGSERINVNGYIEIKTAEPNIWRPKHKVIYESMYGKIPASHIIVFADGDKLNLNPDNLILMSRRQELQANRKRRLGYGREFTKIAMLMADIERKTAELKSRKKWG